MITEQGKIAEYYQALLERDSQYVGSFYVGVKTTKVFCIANCRARKPKPENVIFYHTAKEALENGFRPCKVCKPTEQSGSPPESVKDLISLISHDPTVKISDHDLVEMGIAPEMARRWFKKQHGMTFHAYQRMMRINCALEKLQQGNNVTSSAYGSGFESLSGFGYSFKNIFDQSPENAGDIRLIYLDRFTTPLGPMYVASTDKGICLLEFTDRKILEREFRDLCKRLNARIVVGKNRFTKQAQREVTEFFEGTRKNFEVPLDAPGTDFQIMVWNNLRKIPFAVTMTYKELAKSMGRHDAVRAVARANGMNRISIIIPCHRIIGSNGELTGYGGGLPRKKWLLDHEFRSHHENVENKSSENRVFGSDLAIGTE